MSERSSAEVVADVREQWERAKESTSTVFGHAFRKSSRTVWSVPYGTECVCGVCGQTYRQHADPGYIKAELAYTRADRDVVSFWAVCAVAGVVIGSVLGRL